MLSTCTLQASVHVNDYMMSVGGGGVGGGCIFWIDIAVLGSTKTVCVGGSFGDAAVKAMIRTRSKKLERVDKKCSLVFLRRQRAGWAGEGTSQGMFLIIFLKFFFINYFIHYFIQKKIQPPKTDMIKNWISDKIKSVEQREEAQAFWNEKKKTISW